MRWTAIDENNEPLTEVLVTVEIDAITSGTTIEVPLTARDLSDGYEVELSVETVDVILTGPAVVIDELNTALVEAYVDLSGLEEGTHQLKTSVELLVAQNPNLADLVVTSISPAFVEGHHPVAGYSHANANRETERHTNQNRHTGTNQEQHIPVMLR